MLRPPIQLRTARSQLALVPLLALAALAGCAAEGGRPAPNPALRIGTSLDYHPFSSVIISGEETPAEGGTSGDALDIDALRIDGFDIAVARAFAASRGAAGADPSPDVQWRRFVWPELQRDFEADRFDIAMSGVTVRPERSLAGRFSLPVAVSGAVAIAREGFATRPSQLDRAGVVLVVNAGGHLERLSRSHFPSATVVGIPDNSLVMPELLAGRADAAITDIHEVASWLGDHAGLAVIGPFSRDYKAYWVQPSRVELARELDAWLFEREADGTLDRLRRSYFGPGNWERTATAQAALDAAVAERRALMPLVAEAKRDSGAAVEDREREAVVVDAGIASVVRAAKRLGVEPPDEARVRAFFRREIEEAKRIQRETLASPRAPSARVYDLGRNLRPALLRIGDKIAMLLVERSRATRAEDDADLAARSQTPISSPRKLSNSAPPRLR